MVLLMKCDKCKSDAVIYPRYNKKHLCAKHFEETVIRRVKKAVRELSMIRTGETVIAGLSGGKDSTTLAYVLKDLQKSLPFELKAIIIDEGIKGYRNISVEYAKKIADDLGIRYNLYKFKDEFGYGLDDLAKKFKAPPCSYCGVFRRYLMNKKAREMGGDRLAIGHNLDDVAQTALLNLIRNEPMRFARFNEPLLEPDEFVKRIRPLIYIPEKETAVYAMLKGYDLSEKSCCPYVRRALRRKIRHYLNLLEHDYPGTKHKVARSFFTLQKKLRKTVKIEKMNYCKKCGEPSAGEICMFCRLMKELTS